MEGNGRFDLEGQDLRRTRKNLFALGSIQTPKVRSSHAPIAVFHRTSFSISPLDHLLESCSGQRGQRQREMDVGTGGREFKCLSSWFLGIPAV